MLQVVNLSQSYGIIQVLNGVTFVVNHAEHVGLIGPNGAGKSTLLRCIAGIERPTSGSVTLTPVGSAAGYLAQTPAADASTVGDALAAALDDLTQAAQAIQQAADALAADTTDAALDRYDTARTRFEALGGYARLHDADAVVAGLGLGNVERSRTVTSLSGGQTTRLGLAMLLLRAPSLLLLDEPTNHLDLDALDWLRGFVRSYRGAALIVSHDRDFLDHTVTRTLYLDPTTHTVTSYPGGYREFAAARAHEQETQQAAWADQRQYVREVEADIRRVKGQASAIQSGPKRGRDHYGRVSAKVARVAKAREQKLHRYLESAERVEKPRQSWNMKLDFGQPPPSGRAVLRLERVGFAYPDAAPLFHDLTLEVWHGDRVALTGPNGAGKTTLLRLIEGVVEPAAGSVRLGANIRLGVLAQAGETLDPTHTVLETVLRERAISESDARTFLHLFLFGGDAVFRRVGQCSMGERTRLQLARLVLRGCNLLLLDEPLNHLDIEGRHHVEQALAAFAGTVIAVAHDRAFLRAFATRVIDVRDGTVRVHEGGYEC